MAADDPRAFPGIDSLLIERATPEHIPYLQRLKLSVMADRYRPAADEDGFQRWKQVYCSQEYFDQLFAEPGTMMLSIGSLREPVGMVVLRRFEQTLEIDDLLCRHSRHGDGTRLLVAAMRYAEAWRMSKVYIDVYPGHAHVEPFLSAHGFELTDEVTNELGHAMHRYGRRISSDA